MIRSTSGAQLLVSISILAAITSVSAARAPQAPSAAAPAGAAAQEQQPAPTSRLLETKLPAGAVRSTSKEAAAQWTRDMQGIARRYTNHAAATVSEVELLRWMGDGYRTVDVPALRKLVTEPLAQSGYTYREILGGKVEGGIQVLFLATKDKRSLVGYSFAGGGAWELFLGLLSPFDGKLELTPRTGPFAGTYRNAELVVESYFDEGRYTGTINYGGQAFPFVAREANGALQGGFESHGQLYDFTARLQGNTLTLTTADTPYILTKQTGNPLAKPKAPK